MKRIILIIIVFIGLIFIKIPKYIELNNLIIVEGIGLECRDEYTLYIKEVIPIKSDNGITYKYKIYENKSNEIDKLFDDIIDNSNKLIFYRDAKYIITNCDSSSIITDKIKLNVNYIKHTKNNIKKELSKS
jgi:hypothetical protein